MGDLHIIDKEPCNTSSTVISHTTGSWEGWAGIHLAWINQTIYREGAIWTTCSDWQHCDAHMYETVSVLVELSIY